MKKTFMFKHLVTAFLLSIIALACSKEKGESSQSKITIPVVTTNTITEISTSTAKGGGVIIDSGGAPILSKGICWSTTSNPTVNTDETIQSTDVNSKFSISLKDLLPNTKYYVRAFATNQVGTNYGNEVSFTTNYLPLAWTPLNKGIEKASVISTLVYANSIFAGTYNGLYQSKDGGKLWSLITNGIPSAPNYIYGITVSGANLIVGSSKGFYKSGDNGNSWIAVTAGLRNGISVFDFANKGADVFASTDDGLYISMDNGSNWSLASTLTPSCLLVIGDDLYAGTGTGVLKSSDNGKNWTVLGSGLPENVTIAALGTDGKNMYAGTSDYGAFISRDNGKTWKRLNIGLPFNNFSVLSINVKENNIYFGTGAGVFFSKDNGSTWSSFNAGLPENSIVFTLMIHESFIYAGTHMTGLYKRAL